MQCWDNLRIYGTCLLLILSELPIVERFSSLVRGVSVMAKSQKRVIYVVKHVRFATAYSFTFTETLIVYHNKFEGFVSAAGNHSLIHIDRIN